MRVSERVLLARSQCVIELRRLCAANPSEPCFDDAREALRVLDAATREKAFAGLRVVDGGSDAA